MNRCRSLFHVVCLLGIVPLVLTTSTFSVAAEPVPRVLLAGDSWGALMQAFGTFQTVFPEFEGCEDYRSIGFRTAVVGMRASEFDGPVMLTKVAEELALYPTIDIVHLSLGGNDILYGSWRPTMSPGEQQALFDGVTAHVENVIDFILAQRPDIRIGLCGYTFGDHEDDEITPLQANQAILALEQTKLAMVQGKERVFYIHNLGLMQYSYGIPQADPAIPPMTVPYPGGYPGYTPMPGGNMNYAAPEQALVDSDIHLTPEGYAILARRCMNEFYLEWLSWPRVMEVVVLDVDLFQTVFQVTFSKEVVGVDTGDFQANAGGKALTVSGVSGSGALYTVTVLPDGSGTPGLTVLDDDSIRDLADHPLGGPGNGNGVFSHVGALQYEDPPVLADDDFDAFLSFLDISTAPYVDLLNGFSFSPDRCDANGGFHGLDPVSIDGNGLLDSCEFGLIQAVLRDASLDLSATDGARHSVVAAAWQQNLTQMRADLGGSDGLALSVLRGLDSILAAYFLLGDQTSVLLPSLLVFAAVNYNEFPLQLTVPDRMLYRSLQRWFAFSGDADGDGFSNQEEYDYFMPLGGRDLYIRTALAPGITPESSCANTEGGVFMEGDMFCLVVPGTLSYTAGFQWKKDGVALVDGEPILGSQWHTLHIMALRLSDSGEYTCEYDDGSKAPQVFGPVKVEVLKATPALSGSATVLLASLLFVAFVVSFRVSGRLSRK